MKIRKILIGAVLVIIGLPVVLVLIKEMLLQGRHSGSAHCRPLRGW